MSGLTPECLVDDDSDVSLYYLISTLKLAAVLGLHGCMRRSGARDPRWHSQTRCAPPAQSVPALTCRAPRRSSLILGVRAITALVMRKRGARASDAAFLVGSFVFVLSYVASISTVLLSSTLSTARTHALVTHTRTLGLTMRLLC